MNANMLRRLNWLWKHRHTHDGDRDCCAGIAELRLQVETAADIRQHLTGSPPDLSDWVTYGTFDDGTTHDWLVPASAQVGDLGLAVVSLFVHPTSGSPATAIGTVPSGWTLEGSASGTGALHYFYSKTLTAGDLASGQTFTITEGAQAHVAAAWGVVQGGGQTVTLVAKSSVGGGIDLPAVSVGGGTYWIVTLSSLNKGIPTGNDPDGAVSAGYTLAAYKSSLTVDGSDDYNAAVFVQKQRLEVASSETPADLDWAWASPGRNSAGMTLAITGTEGTPAVLPGDAVHNDLGAREEDDNHPQYSLIDGSRAYTGDLSMDSNKITSLADPTTDQDAATKKYVDDNAAGGGSTVTTGTVTVTNGSTTGAASHGLVGTPAEADFQLTPRGTLGSASEYWVSATSLTEVEVTVDTDPGTDVTFAWMHAGDTVAADYATEITNDGPIAYYRLGESSGTTAFDEVGSNDASYVGTHTLGQTGGVGDADTAVAVESDGHILVPDLGQGTPWSVEMWIKPDTLPSDNRPWSPSVSGRAAVRFNGGNFQMINDAGSVWQSFGAHGMTTGNWYHVVVTHSGTTATAYINGSVLPNTVASTRTLLDDPIEFGRRFLGSNGSAFDGTFDEISLWDRVLSASEVANHYAAATS